MTTTHHPSREIARKGRVFRGLPAGRKCPIDDYQELGVRQRLDARL